MSVNMSRNGRPLFENSSLDGGTIEELAQAFSTIVAYSGNYVTDDQTSEVTHLPLYATLPRFVGQRMRRICIFEGNRLKLDTPTMIIGGVSRESYIEWERI